MQVGAAATRASPARPVSHAPLQAPDSGGQVCGLGLAKEGLAGEQLHPPSHARAEEGVVACSGVPKEIAVRAAAAAAAGSRLPAAAAADPYPQPHLKGPLTGSTNDASHHCAMAGLVACIC